MVAVQQNIPCPPLYQNLRQTLSPQGFHNIEDVAHELEQLLGAPLVFLVFRILRFIEGALSCFSDEKPREMKKHMNRGTGYVL